ncbi:MAG: fructose-6-phosphate aldolase [Spirochaetaceae bacterium]|jgi:transaldolase|nr:fructose-6-phosphate aldolase [Spirochaetaceae bacterium]
MIRIFLDTANIDEIREAVRFGIIEGVTTNPSILSREGSDWKLRIKEIVSLVRGQVFAEVFSTDADGMIREGREIAAWDHRMVIKIPMIPEGVKAINALSSQNISTAATMIYSPAQAVIAAAAGAQYVATFIGRAFEINQDGVRNIEEIAEVYRKHQAATKILAASVRNAQDALRVLLAGADCITVSFSVIKQMMSHPMTDITLRKFLDDWGGVEKCNHR